MYVGNEDDLYVKDVLIHPSDVELCFSTVRINGTINQKSNVIFYIVEGELIVIIDGIANFVRKNQAVFLPKNKRFILLTTFSQNLQFYRSAISVSANGATLFDLFTLNDFVITIKNPQKMAECFQSSMKDDNYTSVYGYHLNRVAKIMEILAMCFESSNSYAASKSHNWMKLLSFMDENINKSLSLQALADFVFLHPNYLVKKFKQDFGISPMKYYNNLRIKKIIQILYDTDMSINDIALEMGFSDQYYFSYFFKERCGISPQECKDLLKKAKKEN